MFKLQLSFKKNFKNANTNYPKKNEYFATKIFKFFYFILFYFKDCPMP